MKANLTFDLSDPDDKKEFLRCAKSLDMAIALWDILHNTKKTFERELENKPYYEQGTELLDQVFSKIWEITEENGINIDELLD
jgi:hypothetical protein